MRKLYIILAAALLVFCGCSETNEVDSEFLKDETPCLKIDGNVIHQYNPLTWQLGYKASDAEFRVHNDTMSDYYVVELNSVPQKTGETITGNLIWTSEKGVNRLNDLDFKVEKINGNGVVWLWQSKENIAVSVQIL